jgi:hypothetical protein
VKERREREQGSTFSREWEEEGRAAPSAESGRRRRAEQQLQQRGRRRATS